MGDRSQHRLGPPGSIKRRKSLFRLIADSISSFVPSNLFGSNNTDVYSSDAPNGSVPQCTTDSTGCSRDAMNVRDCDTQTFTVMDSLRNTNVDLDAVETSEGELSAHSSTSGVSSLIPRNVKTSGIKCGTHSAPVGDATGRYVAHSRSATCSDAMDSIESTSTFRPSSVTPWILSHGYRRPDSPISRPTKRQRISCDRSSSSFCESDRMSLFYRAKTTYGGAASCRSTAPRNGLFEATTPLRFELEGSHHNSTVRSDPLTATNLSSTARRILESLERFTTPLATADRVPLPLGVTNETKSTPFPIKKTFRSHRFPPYMQAYKRLKTMQQERCGSIPVLTAVSENASVTCVSTTCASTALSQSTTSNLSTAPLSTVLCSTPTLTVGGASGFSFQNMPLLRKPNPTVSLTPSASVPVTLSQPKSSKNDKSITYTFSSPIRRPPSVAAELVKLSSSNTVPKFSFSSPLRSSRSSSALFYAHSDYPVSSHTNPSNPVVSTSSSPIFTLIVKSSADSDSHTTSKAPEPKPILPTFDSSKSWRCETCMQENPQSKNVCSTCTMPRIKQNASLPVNANSAPTASCTGIQGTTPISTTKEPATISTSQPMGVLSSTSSSSRWECPVCMIFNEATQPKCIACGASPESHSEQPARKSNTTNSQSVISEEASKKWECPTCMVFNDGEKTTCVCCQTSKPDNKPKTTVPWECPTCMVSNTSDKEACPCCSTPKPKSSTTSTSTSSTGTLQTKFSLPATPTSLVFGTSNTTVKFGLPTTSVTANTTSSVSSFGVLNSTSTTTATTNSTNKVLEPAQKAVENFISSTPSTNLIFGNSATNSVSSTTVSMPFLFGKPTTANSTPNSTPFPFSSPSLSSSPPVLSCALTSQPDSSTAPVFTFGRKRRGLPETSTTPAFQFPAGPATKAPLISITNGLVNGDSTVSSLNDKEKPVVASNPTSGGFNFTSVPQPVAPKFEFGSPKLISVPSTTGTHPTFTFGSSFSATPGASNISSTNSNLNSVAPATQTAPAFGGIQLGASVSAPFSFGSAQPNCTSSTTAGNIFCFGSNTQATDAPGSKPPLSFGAPTPLPPGQSANSSSNLFSANASEISARKKVHATRRLNR